MKKKMIIVSVILLISTAIAGSTFAWFTTNDSSIENKNLSTIQVNVLGTNENVQVQNIGTGNAYVRVRLIPQWDDPNLSIANINLDLNIGNGWTEKQADGYYYFKYYLKEKQITSNILNSISLTNLQPEQEGHNYKVKVVAEGVQINRKALQAVWGSSSLPFTLNKAWSQ